MVLMSGFPFFILFPGLTLIRIDANLNCIKGGGACHLREKILAEAAKTFVVK